MKTKLPVRIIELEDSNYHIVVTSEFDNGTTGYWVIDTGASKTVFDENLEEYYALAGKDEDLFSAGIGEQPFKSSLAILKQVKFGKLAIENLKVALLNMNHINTIYENATDMKICGLLGSDFLMKYKAEISFDKKLLVLYKK